MMERMIEAENLTGESEIALGLSMTLETKNNMGECSRIHTMHNGC